MDKRRSVLKCDNISISFGGLKAVNGFNLDVKEKDLIGLIGPNGAGKTTTLQAISSLLEKRSGKITFEDEDITNKKAYKITRLGVAQVPEGRRVFSNLSVVDNINLGSVATNLKDKEREEKIERIYELFPVLKDRRNQKAGTLSGGEQQMLAMARALMTRPKLLLLDEPSMGLSPVYVQKIFETIKILKEEGSTILLVEQNANLALDVSDRAYVLETGKIIKEGPSSDLKDDPTIRQAYLGMA